jgi:hypothetical protein
MNAIKEYGYFVAALKEHARQGGRGFAANLKKKVDIIKDGTKGITKSRLSQILKDTNASRLSIENRTAISQALGYNAYIDMVNFGASLSGCDPIPDKRIELQQQPEPTTRIGFGRRASDVLSGQMTYPSELEEAVRLLALAFEITDSVYIHTEINKVLDRIRADLRLLHEVLADIEKLYEADKIDVLNNILKSHYFTPPPPELSIISNS